MVRSLLFPTVLTWVSVAIRTGEAFVVTTPPAPSTTSTPNGLMPTSRSRPLLPKTSIASSKTTTTQLYSSLKQRPVTESRRKTLVSRNGSHFKLDRFSGTIEFGAAADLVTRLDAPITAAAHVNHDQSIDEWLQDERSLALSIWDPKLMKEMGNNVFRLEVMTLQFVTLQLAPWVDVQMKTVLDEKHAQPVFTLQSVSFDPNVQVLPGLRIDADALGIVIEVAGTMRRSGQGVTGTIAFQTTGMLPPPLRILPEPALKAASDTINQTVVNFAVRSFQNGAKKNYKEFLAAQATQQQQQAAKVKQ